MARSAPGEVDRLLRSVERAMRDNLDAEDILPMLARLARAAAPESEAWIYAHRHLAELGVEHDPWRAALFARRVIAHRPDDDGAWAVLGLAQSLLGNCRYAARAYEHALALAPDNPWYAHNLGHLYDVALDRAADALPLLARATYAQPGEADIAASYAHALARCGKLAMAKRVLKRAIRHGGTADQMALARWLDTFAIDDTGARPAEGALGPSRQRARRPACGPASRARCCASADGAGCGADPSERASFAPEPLTHARACEPTTRAPARKKSRRRRTRERRSAGD
jgi:tetratricopeptide (TPR) repeat protein